MSGAFQTDPPIVRQHNIHESKVSAPLDKQENLIKLVKEGNRNQLEHDSSPEI